MGIKQRVAEVRRRRPFIDHVVRMQEHYSGVNGGQQAGAVTYFAFLSFFPILALAFFVIGWVARIYPQARQDLVNALDAVMPDLIGHRPGQVRLADIEQAAAAAGIAGAVVLLYSGLGWLAGMREALEVVFEVPKKEQPGFVQGKLRDLMTLGLIGLILLVSVGVAGIVGGFSTSLLGWVGLDDQLGWLVKLLTVALGFGANMVLFYAMFRLLAEPHTPQRPLWSGALLGAIAFEVLKQVSGLLISSTQGSPAFQAFGIALIVLVWINYFSRVVLYASAWAHTSPEARAQREQEAMDAAAPVEGPPSPPVRSRADEHDGWAAPVAVGAAGMLGLMAVVRRFSGKGTD